jgi:phosphate transport system substrate-binding protein
MKRFAIFPFLILLLLVGCKNKSRDALTDTMTSGVIKIAVDENFEPIIQEEIEVFEALTPMAGIVPIYCSEVDAVNYLLKDSVRLAITTRELSSQEMESFHSRKFFPRSIKLAIDGIALIVNNQNPDSLISVSQLEKILTGEITDWKELYPASRLGKLQLVFDNPNSSTVRFAMDSICKGKPLYEELKAQKTNSEVINYVARTPGAIGVIGVNWLGNPRDTTNLSFNDRIRVMAVSRAKIAIPENSFKPYQAYLATGSYPLSRNVYILLNDPRGALPSGLTAFLTGARGQRIILKSGLVPATEPVRIVNVKDE